MTQPPFGDHRSTAPVFTVGEALSFGWSRFKENPLAWIGMALLTSGIPGLVYFFFLGDPDADIDSSSYLLLVVAMLVTLALQAAMVRGALDEVNGRKPSFGAFFNLPNIAQILLAGLIVSVLTIVGFILLFIPGVIVFFLSYFAIHFVVDRRVPAIDGIRLSWSIIAKNAGPLLLLALVVFSLNLIGALLCGLGTLVTTPVTGIAVAYAYRTLTDGYVTAS